MLFWSCRICGKELDPDKLKVRIKPHYDANCEMIGFHRLDPRYCDDCIKKIYDFEDKMKNRRPCDFLIRKEY